jgi:hypothetical protein
VSLLGGGNIVVDVDTSNLATKEELNAYATSESLQSLGLRIQSDMDTDKRELTEAINTKQDKIDDLEAIRSGAALGATALQEHQDISHLATKEEVIANEEVHAAALNDLNERLNNRCESGVLTFYAAKGEELPEEYRTKNAEAFRAFKFGDMVTCVVIFGGQPVGTAIPSAIEKSDTEIFAHIVLADENASVSRQTYIIDAEGYSIMQATNA